MLVESSTENPYFEVNSALLSRCRVYELRPLGDDHVLALLRRSLGDKHSIADAPRVDDDALEFLTASTGPPATPARRCRPWSLPPRPSRTGTGRTRPSRVRPRRSGHPARGRGRAAAQRHPLRQGRRPPLRPDLGLDQGHPRLRPGRIGALPGRDDRGRRGPPLHRPADGDPGQRGHRERQPTRAGDRGGGGARGRARGAAGVCAQPVTGGDLPRPRPEVQRGHHGDRKGPALGARARYSPSRPPTCARRPTRARRRPRRGVPAPPRAAGRGHRPRADARRRSKQALPGAHRRRRGARAAGAAGATARRAGAQETARRPRPSSCSKPPRPTCAPPGSPAARSSTSATSPRT